jgi:hypothetical protein
MSKLGIIALMRVMAREHLYAMMNLMDPGYCCMDQNSNRGSVNPARGARMLYLLVLMEWGGVGGATTRVEHYNNNEGGGGRIWRGGRISGGDADNDDVGEDDDFGDIKEGDKVNSGLYFHKEREISWTYQS